MESNYKYYDYEASLKRIDEILAMPQGNYEEKNSLPDTSSLTFTNGFYSNCSAMFVDIRDSSKLPDIYKRPALAKLYRAFISEMVAVFNSVDFAREINIIGDCVSGVYNTATKDQVDILFNRAAKANSLLMVLNYKLKNAGYPTPIKIGIGLEWGRALMIKAGLSGSGINGVVYMGDVVNQAAKLASKGSADYMTPTIVVGGGFQFNLSDDNKKFLSRRLDGNYYCDVIDIEMNNWYKENFK